MILQNPFRQIFETEFVVHRGNQNLRYFMDLMPVEYVFTPQVVIFIENHKLDLIVRGLELQVSIVIVVLFAASRTF